MFVDTADDETRAPWTQQASNWERPVLRLRDAHGHGIDTYPQLRVIARVSTAAADNPPSAAPCNTAASSDDEADREVVVMRRSGQPRLATSQAATTADDDASSPLCRRFARGQSGWVNAISRRACLPAPL